MEIDRKEHKCRINKELENHAKHIMKELIEKKFCLDEMLSILNLATNHVMTNNIMQETMKQIKIKVMKGIKKAIDEHKEIDITKLT